MRYPHLAARIFDTPLLIEPTKARIILDALSGRLGLPGMGAQPGEDPAQLAAAQRPARNAGLVLPGRYARTFSDIGHSIEGVAIVEVEGTLVNRNGTVGPYSGATGYDGIAAQLHMALADPSIRGIALDIESCGGEVAGCFDLADEIHAARQIKPVMATIDGMACSAAYAIASAAEYVTISETGLAGSIGVLVMHCDYSKALAEAGIAVTMIHAGSHKVDGNPFEPLPKAVREALQRDVDLCWDSFVARVARNRGLSGRAVRDTQADTFTGAEAVKRGLADAVMAPRAALAEFIDRLNRAV